MKLIVGEEHVVVRGMRPEENWWGNYQFRGFSRRGVTPEMLPEEWSEEQKEAWIEDGKERMRRSKWMIVPIFALVFTFGVDLIELFFLPFVKELFLK